MFNSERSYEMKTYVLAVLLFAVSAVAGAETVVTAEIGAAFSNSEATSIVGVRARKDNAEVFLAYDGVRPILGAGPVGERRGSNGYAEVAVGGAYVGGYGFVPYSRLAGYANRGLGVSFAAYGLDDGLFTVSVGGAFIDRSQGSNKPFTAAAEEPQQGEECKPGYGHGDKNHCHSGPPGLQ